jgi:tetratricopeptide (TPR) repeat protein
MAKKTDQPEQPEFSEAAINRAKDCFQKAQGLVQKKNYDYAIQWYLNGLEHWPEAVEEGHQPCRAAALFRGGAKIGFTDSMKYKTSGKDAKKAMLNAEYLLSKDPRNVGYMEAMFKNAARANYDKTTMWIGEILGEAAAHEAKPSLNRFKLMRDTYEQLADRLESTDIKTAIAAMERAVEAMSRVRNLKPNDGALANELRDLAGKLTILKGKYSSAESFRDSVRDTESQQDLHDKDRLFQSDERLDSLIEKARAEYEENPETPGKVNALVDLLVRREHDAQEDEAIEILKKAYEATGQYRFKLRADDIRMKQLNRQARKVLAAGDQEKARKHLKEQLRFELKVFKERVKQYPTDMRLRYQYGVRLFKAKRFDDAIPILQEARNEPHTRIQCNLYIGRCFFEKGFYTQAADIFRDTISQHETSDDELGKDLHYWLARSLEADKQIPDALKIYGQIIQWDYNYRKGDVRNRIKRLKDGEGGGGQE